MEEEPGADQPAPQGTPTGAPLDAAPGEQRARTEENTLLRMTKAEAEEQATYWERSLSKERKRNVEILVHTLKKEHPDDVCVRARMILVRAYNSLGNNSLGKENAPKPEEAARVIMKEIRKDSTLRQLAANDKDGRSFF
jgi:hypothetical protein